MENLKDKKVVVVGLARSGVYAAKLLAKLGAKVTVTDLKPKEQLEEYIRLLNGISYILESGGNNVFKQNPGIRAVRAMAFRWSRRGSSTAPVSGSLRSRSSSRIGTSDGPR